jgi:GNAT superfamily N-acetyltransferase
LAATNQLRNLTAELAEKFFFKRICAAAVRLKDRCWPEIIQIFVERNLHDEKWKDVCGEVGEMTDNLPVREGSPTDLPGIATLLAAAFQDEPVMSFIFPDPAVRRRRLPDFFSVIYKTDYAHGASYVTTNGEAATIWRAPGHGHLSFGEMLRQAWPWVAASRTALGRALIYSFASDANHPKEPHWYLHFVGCLPIAQGKGFGGAAIRAGLARCDAEGIPAYLETATESNLAFYRALGFAVSHEWTVSKKLRCWSMFRKAERRKKR